VNAFTETLAIEMKPFGVRVHLVLPGRAPETKFGANAFPHLRGLDNPDYAPMIEKVIAGLRNTSGPVTYSNDVCEAIWKVATDPSSPLRVAAGADAEAWMAEASSRK
jgi:NAD(P)-dependent dehydrogenase (short-subunit alcohol dehydrogenase family)